ncbi:MAG: tripartite tricarboxylate transporter substrate binding protein [Burkholderiales bacterium]|nr:tripartite tricarboxylate transporter substrate binding protein [Burkholderiales bacterium]
MGVQATAFAAAAAIAGSIAFGALAAGAAELPKDFPNRPVRLIVPFPPGGSNDILGRFMALKLTERFKEQVIVDNRPGADGLIGSDIAARATPDGYTLLIVSTSYSMNPAIHKKMPFDPIKDLVPVSMIGTGPNAVVVNPNFAAKTVKDLIALAKAKAGQINYASSGVGGFNHFGGELFNSAAGIKMTHVPYKGGGPAMVDIMAGHVPVLFGTLIQVLPHARSGKLRVLATGGPKRAAVLPDVATVMESGLPYEVTIWWGLLAPKGMPSALVAALNDTVGKTLAEADTRKRLAAEAAEPMIATPAEFGDIIRKDIAKWIKVAHDAKMEAH